jgi:hypothetical protein
MYLFDGEGVVTGLWPLASGFADSGSVVEAGVGIAESGVGRRVLGCIGVCGWSWITCLRRRGMCPDGGAGVGPRSGVGEGGGGAVGSHRLTAADLPSNLGGNSVNASTRPIGAGSSRDAFAGSGLVMNHPYLMLASRIAASFLSWVFVGLALNAGTGSYW